MLAAQLTNDGVPRKGGIALREDRIRECQSLGVSAGLGQNPARVAELRASLNPLSRFDFGMLRALPNAWHWQAKDGAPR